MAKDLGGIFEEHGVAQGMGRGDRIRTTPGLADLFESHQLEGDAELDGVILADAAYLSDDGDKVDLSWVLGEAADDEPEDPDNDHVRNILEELGF